jgi:HSP20 family protein
MDRMFEDTLTRPGLPTMWEGVHVPVDMYETDNDVVIKASLPGMQSDDVDITITGDSLTIKGEHKDEKEVKREHYYRQERLYGSFSRTLHLPSHLKTDAAEATFENGVLTLTIPKVEEVRPKTIKIKAGETVEPDK